MRLDARRAEPALRELIQTQIVRIGKRLGFGSVESHPCAEKIAQGWGAEVLRLVWRRTAGPSTALRFAQDDSHYFYGQDGGR